MNSGLQGRAGGRGLVSYVSVVVQKDGAIRTLTSRVPLPCLAALSSAYYISPPFRA